MNSAKTPVQRCPICRAIQHIEAERCANCGAPLSGVPTPIMVPATPSKVRTRHGTRKPLEAPIEAKWDEGDSDLHEAMIPTFSLQTILLGLAVVILCVGGGIFFAAQSGAIRLEPTPTIPATATQTLVPTVVAGKPTTASGGSGSRGAPIPTNTKAQPPQSPQTPGAPEQPSSPTPMLIPTLALATVTLAPPTPTITPTRGPCTQKANKNDTLYGMAARCGHKHLSIVDVIVSLNGMKDANSLREGQVVEIPWPTPTGGAPAPDGTGPTPGAGTPVVLGEPTLPPGVTWYTVKKGDTAISIAYNAKVDMKALSDLNPEIQFLQCDFSQSMGGPSCQLRPPLGIGQRVRIPAATPTPAPSATFGGPQVGGPTGTATFNAPYSQSPETNMLYESSETPTLRWVASGQLTQNQVYLVTLVDKTINQTRTATTRDLFLPIPSDWQPRDGRPHRFEWSVAVAMLNQNGTAVPSALSTEVRTFTWHSRKNE